MKLLHIDIQNFTRGRPIYQYLAIFSGTLGVLSSGMHYGWPSPSLPKLLKEDSPIPMTNDESSWVVVTALFGCFLGAYIGRVSVNRIGRKYAILLTAVPLFISWIMIAFAKSVPVLIVARILSGVSDGLTYSTLPMYFGEISNPNIRGFAGSYISVAMALGLLLSNVIGSYFEIETAALISAAIPVLLLLTFWWMPESPYYLIMKGRIDKARTNLTLLKGSKDVDDELERLVNAVKEQNASKRNWHDLFTVSSYKRALYIGVGIRAAQQFSGTNAITFYAQSIFKEAGEKLSPTTASAIYFAIYMIVLAFSSVLVDKTGRKPLMVISITGTAITLAVAGVYFYILSKTDIDVSGFSWIPIFALILYVVVYGIGMQPIPTVLIGEVFPTNVKAVALMLCSWSYSASTIIASKFLQVTKDSFGIHVAFFTYTVCCVLSLMFIVFVIPETKGKTLEEIQEELKDKHVNSKMTEFPEKFKTIHDT